MCSPSRCLIPNLANLFSVIQFFLVTFNNSELCLQVFESQNHLIKAQRF